MDNVFPFLEIHIKRRLKWKLKVKKIQKQIKGLTDIKKRYIFAEHIIVQ